MPVVRGVNRVIDLVEPEVRDESIERESASAIVGQQLWNEHVRDAVAFDDSANSTTQVYRHHVEGHRRADPRRAAECADSTRMQPEQTGIDRVDVRRPEMI